MHYKLIIQQNVREVYANRIVFDPAYKASIWTRRLRLPERLMIAASELNEYEIRVE